MILLNIEEENIKEKHICFYTKREGEVIKLFQIKECFYRHPDAPEYALIEKIETFLVREVHLIDNEAGPLLLLEAAQNTLNLIEKAKKTKSE